MYYRGEIVTPYLTLKVEVDKELRIFDSKGLIEFSEYIGNMCFYNDNDEKVVILFVISEEDYHCIQLLYDDKICFAWFSEKMNKIVHCDIINESVCYTDIQLVLNCNIASKPLNWELAVLLCSSDNISFRSTILQQEGGYRYYYVKELAKRKQVDNHATLSTMQGDIGRLKYC